jgi:hypothetical protein
MKFRLSSISESGRGRCRAAGRIEHREGARLPDTARQGRPVVKT